jgi:hypothetical protein
MDNLLQKFGLAACMAAVMCSGCGSVLCQGQDGHIAFEPVVHNHCHHEEDAHHPDKHQQAVNVILNACSPCEDVAIGYDMELVRLHDGTQFDPVDFGSGFLDVVAASNDILNEQKAVSTFFTPLETIRLLT